MSIDRFSWWSNLRHGGLLLDTPRLTALIPTDPADLNAYNQDRLRRRRAQFQDDATAHRGELVSFVLESICGFARPLGEWYRGAEVKTQWSRKAITGESIRPRHLWIGKNGATLPVFVDDQHRIGVGKGRRVVSHVLGWLRQGKEQLALITNGQEWRLVFAGLDYEAFCQWDADSWFAEGSASPELGGFRALVSPDLWTAAKEGEACPLLAALLCVTTFWSFLREFSPPPHWWGGSGDFFARSPMATARYGNYGLAEWCFRRAKSLGLGWRVLAQKSQECRDTQHGGIKAAAAQP